jgi:tRNA(fMet)-specific endonuclease VapC
LARVHRLRAELRARGRLVGERDPMIAATAIAHGLEAVTRDERSFPHVPGASIEQW